MAIQIDLTADSSGNGVDLQAALNDFNTNFSAGSGNYCQFRGGATPFTGEQFTLDDQDSASSYTGGFIAETGTGEFSYNFMNHTVSGNLDSVSFGETLSVDSSTGLAEYTDSSVDISGLNLGNSDTNDVLADLRGGSTDSLDNIFASQGVAINGSAGADVIEGWSGDDVLTGNGGADVFEFDASASFGDDTITDFENGSDQIGLDYNDVTISGDSSHTVITHANGTVTLAGVDFATIDQNDFV
ncbi:calcium-binding protein [Thalassospira profundimaris]|uniref:Calcium-binding protein n=1 Tax=Thalassospira profundimaris TaxID=502049 RepID=A0A367XM54_9PROT|nr:heme acquisition protein HasA [Thalassospira profundimaris]RCK53881.1 calcium-binding protein [Thalassospira profundimaris]